MKERKQTKLDPNLQIRTIKSDWSIDLELELYNAICDKPQVDVSKLTLDEQADLIIEKLSAPPKPKRTLADDYMVIMAKAIAEEIDREILEKLKGLTE